MSLKVFFNCRIITLREEHSFSSRSFVLYKIIHNYLFDELQQEDKSYKNVANQGSIEGYNSDKFFKPYFHNYDFVNSIKFKDNGKQKQTKKLLWHTGDSNRIQNKTVGEKRPTFQT